MSENVLEAQANTTHSTALSSHSQLKIPANHTYRGQTVVNGTLCDVWWFVATNYPFPEVPPSTHTHAHTPPPSTVLDTSSTASPTSGQCVVHGSRPPCSPSHPHGHPTQRYTLQPPPYSGSPLPKPPNSLTPAPTPGRHIWYQNFREQAPPEVWGDQNVFCTGAVAAAHRVMLRHTLSRMSSSRLSSAAIRRCERRCTSEAASFEHLWRRVTSSSSAT